MFDTGISVIVLTYNQKLEKILLTVNSLLMQKNVEMEILICDDGSIDDKFVYLEKYFCKNGFKNYKLLRSEKNRGTILNVMMGARCAAHDLIKLISPGDFLASEDVLEKWSNFMMRTKANVSFGDVIYYNYINDNLKLFSVDAAPQSLTPYKRDDKKSRIFQYYLNHDQIHGAAMMVEKEILIDYVAKLSNIGMKYCEDVFIYIAILDEINIKYIPMNVIWYEYGDGGVSNSTNSKGLRLIKFDMDVFYDYIRNERGDFKNVPRIVIDIPKRRMDKVVYYLKNLNQLKFKIRKRFHIHRKTDIPKDNTWFYTVRNSFL